MVTVVTLVTVEVDNELDDVEDVRDPVLCGTVNEIAVLELEELTQPYGPHVYELMLDVELVETVPDDTVDEVDSVEVELMDSVRDDAVDELSEAVDEDVLDAVEVVLYGRLLVTKLEDTDVP